MLLRLTPSKGMAPSIAPDQLADQAAQVATNCDVSMGNIRPIKGLGSGVTPSKAGTILSIYPYDTKWFNWITDVNCVRSPLADDAFGRRYWTGDGAPKMTAQQIATSTSDYPSSSYLLGIPAPSVTGVSTTPTGTATDDDPLLADTRSYVFTYVSAYGEEGPPSDPTAACTVSPGQYVAITGIAGAPTGSYNIAAVRIYRTNTGSGTTEYQYVSELVIGTTTYNDQVESDALGEVLGTTDYDAPPADLKGLIALPNGCLAGFSKNSVCFSVPYLPHAWPVSYRVPLDDDVVMIGSYGSNLLVTTQGAPYLLQAASPAGVIPERLETGYACISKRGFVDVGYACVYPAINGLMVVGMQGINLVTGTILTQADWQALSPSTIHAYLYDGKVIGFFGNNGGGFIYNPQTNDYTTHDLSATAGYHNPATGTLHIVSDGQIKQWEAGSAKTAVWKSKRFVLPAASNPGCAQVQALAYPVTFKLYADGTLQHTQNVTSREPFRLPSGYRANTLEVEVSGTVVVTQINVASTMTELAQV